MGASSSLSRMPQVVRYPVATCRKEPAMKRFVTAHFNDNEV
jgi:hypothetical protein